jgi:hypothetical protein
MSTTTQIAAQIATLLAWARSLSEAGSNADPTERAAYQAAKTALLARIAEQEPQPSTQDSHTGQSAKEHP